MIKFDISLKSDDNTNNFVESFNNAIVKHKGRLPIHYGRKDKKDCCD